VPPLRLAGALLVTLLAAAPAPAASADSARRPSVCTPPGTRTLEASPRARVFTRGRESFSPVFACHYRTGRRIRLGTQDCFDSRGVELPRLAGRFVAYALVTCHRAPTSEAVVRVRDLRSGRTIARADATTPLPAGSRPLVSVTDLELKPNGSVAWIAQNSVASATGTTPERIEVRKLERRGRDVLLASGLGIVPASLALGGSTLYWTRDGAPFSAALD